MEVDQTIHYEGAIESYRQALRAALEPEEAEAAIEALGELLFVAKQIGKEEARENVAAVDPADIAHRLALVVGDDGTGNLRVIVDCAIANGDSLAIADLAEVVREAELEAELEAGES